MRMDAYPPPKPTLGAYLVGAYLFCVSAFAYSESLGLLMIPQLVGALLIAYALLDILKSFRVQIPKEIGLYGLMGLLGVVTFFVGPDIGEWGMLSLGTLVKVVTATLACAQLIKSESDFYVALRIFVFCILIVFFQNFSDLRSLSVADQIPEMDRFAGTFTDPNTAAIFSLTIIWASILLLLHSRKTGWSSIALSVPIVIAMVIIYYSGSKKGLIGLALFVLFLVRLFYTRSKTTFYQRSFIFLGAVVLLLVAGYFIYRSPFFFRIQQLLYGGDAGDVNRRYLAGDAIEIWLRNARTFLIGVGYDNFRFASDLQTNSHSTPLEILACNGLVGFTLFVSFLTLLFRKFILLYRYVADARLRRTFFLIIVFLAIYSFFMLTHVLHVSRELLPIIGGLAAFGQYHMGLVRSEPAGLREGLSAGTESATSI
jgi:O-antigen ligase